MADWHDVRVVFERDSRHGRIYLDGIEVKGVRAVTVHHQYDARPRVEFEILAATAAIEYVDQLDEGQEVSTDAAP
ncbi:MULTISPECIES: hypothetical protein [unclassified Streptomyces]|uniref:hypothetical protein n=1 Tax=unclassified Streptomyces TaxID=2593676 RepID=UPI0035D5744C